MQSQVGEAEGKIFLSFEGFEHTWDELKIRWESALKLWFPELPELTETDVESDDDNSLPEPSDKELGGDEVEKELIPKHPTPTKLKFHQFVEDVPPAQSLPREVQRKH